MPRKPRDGEPTPQLGLDGLLGGDSQDPSEPTGAASRASSGAASRASSGAASRASSGAASRASAGAHPRELAPAPAPAPAPTFRWEAEDEPTPRALSVGEVVTQASQTLEARFRNLWVEGEVSNLRRISSGHLFFSLKDDRAQLPAVVFRADARRIQFRLEDGLAVRCRGTLRIYEAQGKLQLYVDRMEPVGLGALMLAFEQLKRKLGAEGLFDPQRKRALPAFPRVVGVVTSPTGAAIRDIIDVIGRRFPVPILVSPTPVQGSDAPPAIVAALGRLERLPGVDVIILGRGGGSMEDLWCWNDEAVVRAVAACPVPTVSAVGHETDHTLCDLAADLRAPTPSAAAERVVRDRREVAARLRDVRERLASATRRRIGEGHLRQSRLVRRLGDPRPRLLDARASMEWLRRRQERALKDQIGRRHRVLAVARERVAAGHPRARLGKQRARLEALGRSLGQATRALLGRRQERLGRLTLGLENASRTLVAPARRRFAVQVARLGELSPLRVLARGYALVMDEAGRPVRSSMDAAVGQAVRLRLSEGELGCEVIWREPSDPTSEEAALEEEQGRDNAT